MLLTSYHSLIALHVSSMNEIVLHVHVVCNWSSCATDMVGSDSALGSMDAGRAWPRRGRAAAWRSSEDLTTGTLRSGRDRTPWCSSALNAAFACVGIEPTRLATAASWRDWGVPCALQDGAVVWFPPGDPDAGGTGHVGLFFAGRCLGGNQANRVSLAERDWGRAGAVRWPAGIDPPKPMARVTARALNVRIGPGANFGIVPTGAVDHGTGLCVLEKLGAWLRVLVALPDGKQVPGWCHGGYVEGA